MCRPPTLLPVSATTYVPETPAPFTANPGAQREYCRIGGDDHLCVCARHPPWYRIESRLVAFARKWRFCPASCIRRSRTEQQPRQETGQRRKLLGAILGDELIVGYMVFGFLPGFIGINPHGFRSAGFSGCAVGLWPG